MSLSPPKFIQMLRDRDRASLVADLRALVTKWDVQASSEDMFHVRIATLRDCIADLNQALDAHH